MKRAQMIQSSAETKTRAALARAAAKSERTNVALVNERARILANEEVGPNLYLMELAASHIAASIEPGQFVHMKVPSMEAHILRRPFSVYARDAAAGTLEVLYQSVGFGTDHMTRIEPERAEHLSGAELIGPVGRGWQPPANARRALLVGGGVGAAPLFMLCESLISAGVRTDVVLGAQTEAALTCRGRYEALLDEPPRCATDDGSFGREGFCTSLVAEALAEAAEAGEPYDYLAVCGPEPLMKIVAGMAAEAGVPCEVSMEKRMACGVEHACRAWWTRWAASSGPASTAPCSMRGRWYGRWAIASTQRNLFGRAAGTPLQSLGQSALGRTVRRTVRFAAELAWWRGVPAALFRLRWTCA